MKKFTVFLVIAGTLSILAGCKKEKPGEVVQTVEWFKANEAERTDTLAKCTSNPGELAATPNCINASRAQSSTTWGATGGIGAIDPLSADDIRKNRK